MNAKVLCTYSLSIDEHILQTPGMGNILETTLHLCSIGVIRIAMGFGMDKSLLL